jgi:hypothetical protein
MAVATPPTASTSATVTAISWCIRVNPLDQPRIRDDGPFCSGIPRTSVPGPGGGAGAQDGERRRYSQNARS